MNDTLLLVEIIGGIILVILAALVKWYYFEDPVTIRKNKFRVVRDYKNDKRFQKRYWPGIWKDVTGKHIKDVDIFPNWFPELGWSEEKCVKFLEHLEQLAETHPKKKVIVEKYIKDYTGVKRPVKENEKKDLLP